MPRIARKESKTKIYHIMSRALNKQILFDEEKDFLYFLNLIKETKNNNNFELYGYCIMNNHYHLLIKELDVNISIIMNKINSKYANYYNMKNNRTGYVFNDRFHSENIEDNKYLLTCIRYIHQNPVKANICNSIYEYKFSSIHAYKNEKNNILKLVDTKMLKNIMDNKNFLLWNETISNDKCMDVMNNKLTDEEVVKLLYKLLNTKNKKEYLNKSEAEKIIAIQKLVDYSIPLKQLSRISEMTYYNLKKLKEGKEGKTTSLTYKNKFN